MCFLVSASLSDFLPLHNSFQGSRAYCRLLSLNIYYFSAGSSSSREGASLWGSKHKISHNSIEKTENCCQKCKLLFFSLAWKKRKITLGFKDTLLKGDSTVVNIHVLHIRTSVPSLPPSILVVCITGSWICRGTTENGSWFCRVKGRLGCLIPRESKSTPFTAASQGTLYEDEMKK